MWLDNKSLHLAGRPPCSALEDTGHTARHSSNWPHRSASDHPHSDLTFRRQIPENEINKRKITQTVKK